MQGTLPTRVAERLRRLRDRFGEGVRERQVDHDHDHLTSTRHEHVPVRTFFLGEIWWADRYTLGDHRPYREGSSHRPALVTRREPRPYVPVEAAPSRMRSGISVGDSEAHYEPSGVAEIMSGTYFALALRRPVARLAFDRQLTTLNGAEKQRLSRILDSLRNSGGAGG